MLSLGAVGLVLYLVIVDLGVSAGRIHHGVEIAGFDVGGMTGREAAQILTARVKRMRDTPVIFFAPRIRLALDPKEVKWWPRPRETAHEAMRVGRDNAPFGALADRFRGWVDGVRLDWAGHAVPSKVTAYVDYVERRVKELGFELDRGKFRYKIKRALRRWPRRALRIPVLET
jgi:hypothetical protein